MDAELYDEFGNYIGPEVASDSESEQEELVHEAQRLAEQRGMAMDVDEEMPENRIVLHEDKKYYLTAEEVYPDAETLVQDEDAQTLDEPIIAPIKEKKFEIFEKAIPETEYKREFMLSLMECPQLVRNVAICGHLHHGKTSFIDMLVEHTHHLDLPATMQQSMRYTDTRIDERERLISIKSKPISLVLGNSRDKSYLVHLMDTPGHVNFSDEVSAALRLTDGVLLLLDVAEGMMLSTQRILKQAIADGLSVILVLNKIDRLIIELKLPPTDAYHKIRFMLDEINTFVANNCHHPDGTRPRFSPDLGNVVFASPLMGWSFTLESFARMYVDRMQSSVDSNAFAKRLWGEIFYSNSTRRFSAKQESPDQPRSFVYFVLEPLYKLYAHSIGEDIPQLSRLCESLGIYLGKEQFNVDAKLLCKNVLSAFFGSHGGLVDAIVSGIPSPLQNTRNLVRRHYTGPLNSELCLQMEQCDSNGPLVLHVCKLYTKPDCSGFDAFARVISGTIRVGQRVQVLGENFTLDDDEDRAVSNVTRLWVYQSRYRIEVTQAVAGNWILVENIDSSIAKTATVFDANVKEPFIFEPIRFDTLATVKLAIEPIHPAELPKMVEGLRKINKSYPLAHTRVEESGEHNVFGTGELYLDCIMHDLRKMYADIEIKVADPTVSFSETAVETSSFKCFAETPNKRNKLTMVAQPLERGMAEDIERGEIDLAGDPRSLRQLLQQKYEWDILAARSLWAFGPSAKTGANVLIDDTLPTEVDKKLLANVRDAVVQGFQWATREGPLCEEPIRNVKFKLLDASLAAEPIYRGSGQIIPTARRVLYSSFLTASPRLMEPIFYTHIQAPGNVIPAIQTVLARRRGHITKNVPTPGSPLYSIEAYLPVIDSFGFETDLRVHTQSAAFCQSVFDHWALVPGDPMDKSIVLRPLEPQPPPHLAREFMLKTRRRKGLADEVTVNKFFDQNLMLFLAQEDTGLDFN